MSMYHFSDTEAVEHDVNTVPDSGDFERVEIDGQWYVPERTCRINLSKTSVWHCDSCGQTIDGNCFADNGGRLTEYRYCPSCGARVMDE